MQIRMDLVHGARREMEMRLSMHNRGSQMFAGGSSGAKCNREWRWGR